MTRRSAICASALRVGRSAAQLLLEETSDEQHKHERVVYEPVKLTQEFRNFDFLSPWEGAEYSAPVLPGDEKAAR